MAIKTFKMKSGPVPKKITPYLKRVGKSFGLAAVDVVSELNPTLSSMAKDTRSTMQDVAFKIKDMTGQGTAVVRDLFDPKGDNAVHNLIDSLKTGEWYKKSDPFDLGGDFNFDDDDWGDDDYESSSDYSSSSTPNAATASDVAAVGAEISTNFGKVAASSAEYIVQNNKIASQAIYNVTTNGFMAVNSSLTGISSKLQTLAEMQAPLLTQAQNTFVFQTKASEFFETTNSYLEKMTDSLEQIKANTSILNATPGKGPGGKKKVTLGSLITGGDFNFTEYFDFIKNNIKESTEMIKMFADLGTMQYGKNFKNFSVTGAAMKFGMTKLIPEIYRDMMKDFNEQLSASIPLALKKLSNKNAKGEFFASNPLLSFIMDMIVPPATRKTAFNAGNYNKGPVPWDGVARKALVEVIPTYLAKIYASLGGEEKYFDYESGKYVSVKYIKGITDAAKNKIFQNSAGDFRTIANSRMTTNDQKRDIEKWLKEVAYNTSGSFDPTSLILDVSKAKKGDLVQGMDYDTARLVAKTLKSYGSKYKTGDNKGKSVRDSGDRAKLAKALRSLLEIPDEYAKYLEKEEESGRSLLSIANNDFLSDKNKSKWGQKEYLYSIDRKLTMIIKSLNGVPLNSKISVGANGKLNIVGRSGRASTGRERTNVDAYNIFEEDDYLEKKAKVDRLNKTSFITGKKYHIDEHGKIVAESTEDELIDRELTSDEYADLSIAGKAKYKINKLKRKISDRSKKKSLTIYDKMYDVLDKMSLGLTQMLFGDGEEDSKTVFDRIKDTLKEKILDKLKSNLFDPIKDEFDIFRNFAAKKFTGIKVGFDMHRQGFESGTDGYYRTYNKRVYKKNYQLDLLLWARQNKFDKRVINDIKKGFIDNKDDARKANLEYEKEKRLAQNEATVESFAKGGMVTKSGLIAVSRGEIIIPSQYNPRYHGINNKRSQLNTERSYVNRFYGMYANGDLDGADESGSSGSNGGAADNIKSAYQKYKNIKGATDNAKRAIKDASDSMMGIVNSALKTGDKIAAQVGVVASGAFNVVTGGITDFLSAITGDFNKEGIQKQKEAISEKAKTIFGEITNNKGAVGVGAIVGTGASLLSGAVVGPLAGAAIGAGAGLLFRSEQVQEMLFGKKPGETDEQYAKSMRGRIKNFIQSDTSKDTLFGSALGAGIGLFAGSPVIGAVVGGAAGFVASSDTAQKALFGSLDAEGHHTKTLGKILDKLKVKFPSAIAGAGLAALLGGPFGLVGNLALGGALGTFASSEKFREYMFGKDGTGKDEKSFTGLIRTKIINNVDEIAHNTLNMIKGIGRRILTTAVGVGKSVKNWLAGRAETISRDHPLLGKLISVPGKIAKAPIHLVGGALGAANRGIQRLNIRHGDEIYDRNLKRNLTAEERLERFGTGVGVSELDEYLANADYDQIASLRENLSAVVHTKQASTAAFINNANTYFGKIKASLSTDTIRNNVATLNAMYKAMKAGKTLKVEAAFNKLASNANISAETELLVREAIVNIVKLSDEKNAVNEAKKALKGLGLNINKSGKLATYLNRIESEMKLTGNTGTDENIDQEEANQNAQSNYQMSVLERLEAIYKAVASTRNEDGTINTVDLFGHNHRQEYNSQGELVDVRNDAETDKANEEIKEFQDDMRQLPHINNRLGIFASAFNKFKEFFTGNKEEKKQGIFDKLFGEEGLFSTAMSKLGSFLGIGSGISLAGVLTTAISGLGLAGLFSGAFDKLGELISSKIGALKGNDTKGTVADSTTTTATLSDGSVVPIVVDNNGNPVVTQDASGNDCYTTTNGELVPVNAVKSTQTSNVKHSVSSDMKRNLFSGSSVGLTMATGNLKYLGVGGKTYSKIATGAKNIGKGAATVGSWLKTGISKITSPIAAKNQAKKYAAFKAARAAGASVADAGAAARKATMVGKITSKIDDIMAKIGKFLVKKFPKGAKLAGEVADGLKKFIINSADNIAAKLGIKAGANASKVIPIAGWIIYGLDIVGSAADCWGNAESVLGIVDEATTGQRVIAAIVGALNAAIPIIGNLIPNNVIVNIIITAGKALGIDFGSLEEQRSSAKEQVAKYNEMNGSNLSIEEYNQLGINYNAATGEFTQGKSRAGWKYKAAMGIKKLGKSIKEGFESTAIGRGIKDIAVINKDLFTKYVIKGDIKGLWAYDPKEGDDEENEMSGFMKALVNISKVYHTPRTLLFKLGIGIKDRVVKTFNGIKTKLSSLFNQTNEIEEIMEQSSSISDFFNRLSQNTLDKNLEAHGDDASEISGFYAAGRMLSNTYLVPLALLKFAGKKIGGKISEVVSTIPQRFSNFMQTQENMINMVKEGDFINMIKYGIGNNNIDSGNSGGGGDDSGADPVGMGFITKAIVNIEKTLLVPLAFTSSVFHGWKNIFDAVSNEIGGDVTNLQNDFATMGKYAAEGKVEDVMATKSEMTSKISGVFDVIGGIGRVFYTLGAMINNVIQPIKDFFAPIVEGVQTWVGGVGDALSKFGEKVGNGWSEFWNGFFGSGSEIPSGGSSGFVSQLDSRYAGRSYAGTTFGDKGCGPAVASMAASSLGKNLSVNSAINKAKGYQTSGGTRMDYFRDALGGAGARTRYLSGTTMKQDALNSLSRGEKVIMLGRDGANRSKANSPFGPNNHYVLATGLDRNGNIRVNDPEARGPRSYKASSLLNGMRMGVAASGGASGMQVDVSKFSNAGLSQEEMGRRARNQIQLNKSVKANVDKHNTYNIPDDVATNIYKQAANLAEAKQIASDMGFTDEKAVTDYYNDIKNNRNINFEGDIPKNNAEKVWAYFASKGLPAEGIAGILGNMKRESQVDPQRVQGDHSADLVYSNNYTANVDNGNISRDDFVHKGPNGNGYGLVQFTYHTWKEMLYDSAKANNVSIGNLGNQLDQVNTQAKDAIAYLRTVTSPEDAAYAFLRKYENPQCDDAVDIRKANARAYYDAYKDKKFRWDGITYSAPIKGGSYGSDYSSSVNSSANGGEKHTIFNLISRLASIFSLFGMNNQADDSDTYDSTQTYSTGSTGANGIGNSTISGGMANNFPYFNQADSPWGSQPYGSHNTIRGAACGPTSMAMVMKSYGINTDPLETANWSADHGYRATNGTSWDFFKAIGEANGLKVNQLEGNGASNAAVLSALNSKYPVIASMKPGDFTKGGHFIVLSGLTSDGNMLVNDPGSRARTQSSPWTPAENVLNQAKQFWVVSDSNGLGSIGGYSNNKDIAAERNIPEWQKAEYQRKNYASGVADVAAGDSGLTSNGISSEAVNALLQSIAKLLGNVSDNSDYIAKIYGVLAKYIGTENGADNRTTGSPSTSYRPTKAKELSTNLIELSAALANIAKG